jgi:uncharacterized protein YecE (DUF72 family)
MPAVWIGCSGWSYDAWANVLYEPKLPSAARLRRYAEVFDTVEVNATFYRLQPRATTARWFSETPPRFVFAVKASRYLTHVRRLRDVGSGERRFADSVAPLGVKLGPVLWQLPPDFARDEERLAATLELLTTGRHCFEFRHPSWFCEPVLELLRAHGAALVIADREGVTGSPLEPTADWMYLRFHAGTGRGGSYTERALRTWAARIRDWGSSVDVYAYFNNDWEGLAPRNATRLKELLAEA